MNLTDYKSKKKVQALYKKVARSFFCSESCIENFVSDRTEYGNRALFATKSHPEKCAYCGCGLSENNSQYGYGGDLRGEHLKYAEGLKRFFNGQSPENPEGDYAGWTKSSNTTNQTGIFRRLGLKRTKSVNNNGSMIEKVKSVVQPDVAEGQKRLIARQATRLIRDSAVVLASRSDAEMAAKAAAFLNTDVGEALVALVTSALASQLPDRYRTPEIDEIIREIRVGTITDKADEAIEVFMAPLRQAGLQLLLAKKANALTSGEAEPAKLEEPKKPARKTAEKHPAVKVAVKVVDKD